MKTNIFIIGFFVCNSLLCANQITAQDLVQTVKAKDGFTCKIPADWKQIDTQALEGYTKELAEKMPNAKLPLPSHGFEPDNIKSGVEYPNILVLPTVMPKNVGGATIEDLKKLANKTKERLQKNIDSKLQDNSMNATANVKDVSYDENGQFVRIVTVGEVPDIGVIHSVSVLFGTTDGMLTFQFNSRESDYGQYADLFSKIISTIQRPPIIMVTRNSTEANSSLTNRPTEAPFVNSKEEEERKIDAIANWIGRIIIPAIIIAIIAYYKLKKSKR